MMIVTARGKQWQSECAGHPTVQTEYYCMEFVAPSGSAVPLMNHNVKAHPRLDSTGTLLLLAAGGVFVGAPRRCTVLAAAASSSLLLLTLR